MFIPEIKSLHIELTNRCNAACPMCMRTFNDEVKNDVQEINLESFMSWFSPELIAGLTKIKFCGNSGDPAIAKDCLSIHEYVLKCNPNIQFLMNTNGGVRTTTFWKKLGSIYAQSDNSFVTFHIDGLEDTNHIYRQGVKWSKLMNNVEAYNSNDAVSLWAFIPFFHNEHQVEEAELMAPTLGFNKFALKISARWNNRSKPFSYEGGKLYPPTSCEFNIDNFQVYNERPTCVAKVRGELYIDAWGRLLPCCWIGSGIQAGSVSINDNISLYDNDINTIMQMSYYAHDLEDSWNHKHKSSICHKRCTGSQVHVWEENGVKKPQKDMWYNTEKINEPT